MKIKIFLSLFIFSQLSFGTTGVELGKSESFQDHMRWAISSDYWRHYQPYTEKGHFFRISSELGEKKLGNKDYIAIYKTPDLTGKFFKVNPDRVYLDEKERCLRPPMEPDYSVEDIFRCQGSCQKTGINKMSSHFIDKFKNGDDSLYDVRYKGILRKSYEDCNVKFDIFIKYFKRDRNPEDESVYEALSGSAGDHVPSYYFRTSDTDLDKGYVEIEANSKKYYVDARDCKKDPRFCKFIDIKESDYENDQTRLKEHQEKKDIYILNVLLNELKPCVQKKDLKCIKKYFVTPTSHNYLVERQGYMYPNVSLDEDFLKELSACLDYDKLLPHLLGTRGVNKVCMFLRRGDFSFREDKKRSDQSKREYTFLIGIDYPEAMRLSEFWETLYYVKEKK
jgi:hypothetical protein